MVEPADCKPNTPEESPVTANPPPAEVTALIVVAMLYPYKTIQRLPLGIVTDTPPATVTGPVELAEYPLGIL